MTWRITRFVPGESSAESPSRLQSPVESRCVRRRVQNCFPLILSGVSLALSTEQSLGLCEERGFQNLQLLLVSQGVSATIARVSSVFRRKCNVDDCRKVASTSNGNARAPSRRLSGRCCELHPATPQARDQPTHHHPPSHQRRPPTTSSFEMADKMDIDAVNGEKREAGVGPAPDLPPERSTSTPHQTPNQQLMLMPLQLLSTTLPFSIQPWTASTHDSPCAPSEA